MRDQIGLKRRQTPFRSLYLYQVQAPGARHQEVARQAHRVDLAAGALERKDYLRLVSVSAGGVAHNQDFRG